jgi:hypothetical protein
MAASQEQIATLRRMTAEYTPTETYDDSLIAWFIESRPLPDAQGNVQYERLNDGTTSAEANSSWTPTYDLAAAAADVWEEKQAALTEEVDTSVDGASLARSQAYDHAGREARKWRSRSHASSVYLAPSPRPLAADSAFSEVEK